MIYINPATHISSSKADLGRFASVQSEHPIVRLERVAPLVKFGRLVCRVPGPTTNRLDDARVEACALPLVALTLA
jgi:hypothetical protein